MSQAEGEPVIIAIDGGTKCGYAIIGTRSGRRIDSGVWRCAIRAGRGRGDRWLRFSEYLNAALDEHGGNVEAIAIEKPWEGARGKRAKSAKVTATAEGQAARAGRVAYGFVTEVERIAAQRALTVVEVPAGTVKKAATGNGRASKEHVARCMSRRFSRVVKPGDEADALAVGVAGVLKVRSM